MAGQKDFKLIRKILCLALGHWWMFTLLEHTKIYCWCMRCGQSEIL